MHTIISFFMERLEYIELNGIQKSQIVIDPGMGYFISGNAIQSFEVIRRISELHEFDLPLLLGPSRKSFLAEVSSGRSLNFSERDLEMRKDIELFLNSISWYSLLDDKSKLKSMPPIFIFWINTFGGKTFSLSLDGLK